MKKSIAAAALVLGLLVVGCNNDADATPTLAPAEAVESMAAEVVDAIESQAAEAVDAVESQAAEVVDALESMLPEASAAA